MADEWLIGVAVDVARLIDSHDPEHTRFSEQIAAHCLEAWDRRQRCIADRTEEILENAVMRRIDRPASYRPDPEIEGPEPLCLGPEPTLAGKYAALAAIHDYCIDEVQERTGRQVPLLDPWPKLNQPQGCEHAEQYSVLVGVDVPKLEPKHADLVHRFLSDVRTDLGATGDRMDATANVESDREATAAKLMADGNWSAVAEIASDTTLSLEEKASRIVAIHGAAATWKAAKWAELLGVSDGRIRQLEFWKRLREAEKRD